MLFLGTPAGAAASRSRSRRPATRARTSLKPSFTLIMHATTTTTPCTDAHSQKHWPTGWSRWSSRSTPRWSTRPVERPFRSKEDARSQRHGQQQQDPNACAAFFARVVYSLGSRWCKRSFSNRCFVYALFGKTRSKKTQSYKAFRLRMSRLCSVRHMPVRCPLAATAVPWLEVPVLAAATASAARTARAVRPLLPPPVSPFP